MRVKEVAIGRADVQLRRGERAAAQDLLIDEPLVVVLVKLGFETGVGNVIGRGPLPDVANHLVTTVTILPGRKGADRTRVTKDRSQKDLLGKCPARHSPRETPGVRQLRGSNVAAFSHSASVGRRLPAHFANAEAS